MSVEIRGLISMGVQGVIDAASPSFERSTGCRLIPIFGTSKALNQRIAEGETADVVIATPLIMEPLVAGGTIVPGSVVPLASSGVGIAVRKGEPKPDISTPEAFVQTLLACRAIGHSDPSGGGASGVHFSKLIVKLGIADSIRPKCRLSPPGTHSAQLLMTREVDLAVQQIPELAYVSGVELVGPLPGELQEITTFVAGVHARAAQPELAKSLLAFLRSPEGVAVFQEKGLEPA